MAVTFMSSVFSGLEVYQVRLDEEIKDEIDLSIESDGDQLTQGTKRVPKTRTTNSKVAHISSYDTTKPNYIYKNHPIKNLHEEEIQNEMLLKHGSNINPIHTSANESSQSLPCIGKPAQQEFIFHKVSRDIYIFSAFWDTRWNDFDNKESRTFIRMMGINKKENRYPPLSCLFYIRGAYHIIPAYDYEMCEGHNQKHGGYIFSCKVPEAVKGRVCSVLVAHGNTADPKWATRIPVTDTQPQQTRHRFSLCIPPLTGNIKENKLVEFIELSRILGSEHITFYNMRAPQNIQKVLQYYQMKDIATLIPWPLPQIYDGANLWYHGQMIAIQDCLYRNMVFTDFVAFNDLDEHIIPRVHRTWHELINAIDESNKYIGYVFESAFFDPLRNQESYSWIKDFEYLTVARDMMRTKMINKYRNKCVVKPREVFEKGIHHVSKPIRATFKTYKVKIEAALLHHYRVCADTHLQDCNSFVEDRRAWKYTSELHERVQFAKKWIDKLAK